MKAEKFKGVQIPGLDLIGGLKSPLGGQGVGLTFKPESSLQDSLKRMREVKGNPCGSVAEKN